MVPSANDQQPPCERGGVQLHVHLQACAENTPIEGEFLSAVASFKGPKGRKGDREVSVAFVLAAFGNGSNGPWACLLQ